MPMLFFSFGEVHKTDRKKMWTFFNSGKNKLIADYYFLHSISIHQTEEKNKNATETSQRS